MATNQDSPGKAIECDEYEYYCKYEKQSNEWFLIECHTQSGYYCPPYEIQASDKPENNQQVCTQPSPGPGTQSSVPNKPLKGMSAVDRDVFGERYYCRYRLFPDGIFRAIQGRCSSGMCCPTNLMEYLIDKCREEGEEALAAIEKLVEVREAAERSKVFFEVVIQPTDTIIDADSVKKKRK